MHKGHGKFLKKLFILLVIMFVVDRVVGSILQHYFENEPMGDSAAFAHAINDPKEDILVYGSSRAVHTYDPRIFTDSLGFSCFNCGRNASNIIYHSAILPAAINGDHKPKAIILDITPKEIAWRSGPFGPDALAAAMLPYVLTNDHFAELELNLFPEEYYKAKVSKLYAYNSLILSIIRNHNRSIDDNVNGYQPMDGSKIDTAPENVTSFSRDSIDQYSKHQLDFFVKSVTEKKIPLIVILSPLYALPFKDNQALIESKQILAKYGIELWDYGTDPRYVKKELFYDFNHLNAKGAEMFSREIASRIKAMGITK